MSIEEIEILLNFTISVVADPSSSESPAVGIKAWAKQSGSTKFFSIFSLAFTVAFSQAIFQ